MCPCSYVGYYGLLRLVNPLKSDLIVKKKITEWNGRYESFLCLANDDDVILTKAFRLIFTLCTQIVGAEQAEFVVPCEEDNKP